MSYREYCRAKEMRQIRDAIEDIKRDEPDRADVLEYLNHRLAVLRAQCGLSGKNERST